MGVLQGKRIWLLVTNQFFVLTNQWTSILNGSFVFDAKVQEACNVGTVCINISAEKSRLWSKRSWSP